ncbi:DUF1641 domain-containing protein [Fodinisporobacter ferrooxydans]|uniref:DUF1641 domain-containing protein n=1 Tax=Fodinisporobacter ferrooxydans TaxID=2901836 RepID=A0ABY4CFF7_9BACL|nr:DUF1641 domain-containing protein [Alicyclobacillaceae bacterium MYW30-H2]
MARAITHIHRQAPSKEAQRQQSLDQLSAAVSDHGDALLDTLRLIQSLHESGALEAAAALIQAREQVTKIAVDQLSRQTVTHTISHAMSGLEVLGKLDPVQLNQLLTNVVNGINRAEETLQRKEKIGLLDLYKALHDPSINRAIAVSLGFLRGVGENL